jgi:hypothetical protein
MINIFHGDNQVASREALPSGDDIQRLEAASLTPEKLEQLFSGNELFGKSPTVIIFRMYKSPLLTQMTKYSTQDIYLWEPKKLTVSQLKKIPQAKVKEFSLPQILWKFLSSLSLKDLDECLKTQPVELVWYLLHRRTSKKGDIKMLEKMFAAELAVKSGKTDLDLRAELEFILGGI